MAASKKTIVRLLLAVVLGSGVLFVGSVQSAYGESAAPEFEDFDDFFANESNLSMGGGEC